MKFASRQTFSDVQYKDGFISFGDCRVFCMREEQAKKPRMRWNTGPRCGDPSARPRALKEALPVGGKADPHSSPAYLSNFPRIRPSLHCAKPSSMTSRSITGTMRAGILGNAKNVLALQYEHFATKMFEVTRKVPKGGVSYLQKTTATTILAMDAHAKSGSFGCTS